MAFWNALSNYLLQNWALILVLLAFIIMLRVTVFLDKKTIIRMYVLIASVFLLSIIVFTEFYLADLGTYKEVRIVMMAIRYSSTPIIIGLILYTLVKKARWYVIAPSFAFAVVNIISIFTGIVFGIDKDGNLVRGALGYLPYVAVGIYSVALVVILIIQSNKQFEEIVPIAFLAFAFTSGLIFPFFLGKEYSKIFVVTIAIGLFVYYVFLILQLTKKDALTGLFNRQAYYAFIRRNQKDVTAIISIDMNGLKTINDNNGHIAGDIALSTLANCFKKACKVKHLVYRIGGDEFVIICRRTSKEELEQLIAKIKENVSNTSYTCSIGYCYSIDESKNLEEMVKTSDVMMYKDKANYYRLSGIDRRKE